MLDSPKPTAVKWLVGLAIARIAAASVRSVLAFYALTPGSSLMSQGIRSGFLRASGYSPDGYGERQAGTILGATFASSLLAILLLVFVYRRSLIGVRVMAILMVLEALSSLLTLPYAIAVAVFAFTDTTKEYCRGGAAVAGPAPVTE